MKMTKFFALAGTAALLFGMAGCKDSSGDMDASGTKWARTCTVDATGTEIKEGDTVIIDSSEGTEDKVTAVTTDGKDSKAVNMCGKRAFKEVNGIVNNTEGFRSNIVINRANTTAETTPYEGAGKRTITVGVLFDYNKYNGKSDFFYLGFKPSDANFNTMRCYFERYTEVGKTKTGIYSKDLAAGVLGSYYDWDSSTSKWSKKYTSSEDINSPYVTLTKGTDYTVDDNYVTIGIDVKQLEKGLYTVRVGKISYTLKDGTVETGTDSFKDAKTTSFKASKTIGKGGETSSGSTITDYTNWTHIKKNDTSINLKGGIDAYAFAPYGTKVEFTIYTCQTKLESGETDTIDSSNDYVGSWNVSPDGVTRSAIEQDASVEEFRSYEEGGVIHDYFKY